MADPETRQEMPTLRGRHTVSVAALVAANLAPLAGVFFADWDARTVLLLYWAENLVVAFYTILKVAIQGMGVAPRAFHLLKLPMVPFFCLHYGGFCALHGMFVLVLVGGLQGGAKTVLTGASWPGPLVFVHMLVLVIVELWRVTPNEMAWPLLGLGLSHGVSFVRNYVARGGYRTSEMKELMEYPYKRMVPLHVAIIVGVFPLLLFGSPIPLVVLLVLLKIALDVYLHKRSHRARKLTSPRHA